MILRWFVVVYLLLVLLGVDCFDCFVDYFGSVEKLAEACVWIPTFEEARAMVETQLSVENFKAALMESAELDFLYRQLITELQNSQ